ncbi:MAG: TIM-barrel domain-containing protein, partial [candidate division KSB1 bacterium]|nr:TIM-barrel domain-containing protein [candidate division KSB1 bacterium]
MWKILILCLCLSACIITSANGSQYRFIGDIVRYSQQNNILTIACDNANVEIMVIAEDVIRVRMVPGEIPETHSFAVLPLKKTPPSIEIEETERKLVLKTERLILEIKKQPCRLTFMDTQGNVVCKDHDSYGMGWRNGSIHCWKELHDEPFFGLGEKTRGLNKRGNVYTMWNSDIPGYTSVTDPIYQSHPFFLSMHNQRGFGIFFDNSYKSTFNFGAGTNQFYSFGAEDGVMDYYFIYGPQFKHVISKYSELVGTLPLPPKWSLGYQQCRWSYYPDREVLELAEKFRDKEIPCDVIYLDIHYMDGYRVFTWHPDRFPDPKKMVSKLRDMGFKVVLIIDPGIKVDPEYHAYQQGIQGDYFCTYPDGSIYQGVVWPGDCHFPDFSDPRARKWWGNLYKEHIEEGIAGFWND